MKFVIISGGLGNQMFGYAFCLALQKRGQKSAILIIRKKTSKAYHQGFELERVFNISCNPSFLTCICAHLLKVYFQLLRLFHHKHRPKLLQIIGIKTICPKENFVYYPEVFNFKFKHEVFSGTWQSEKFFKCAEEEVKKKYLFNEKSLSIESRKILELILKSNSVSIHFRKGDYLTEPYIKGFGGICTEEYYSNAIKYIKERNNNAFFFIFSDDRNLKRELLNLENSIFVNFNYSKNSWQDMYLISKCNHNIVANSSFSWWGAWLNCNPNKIVIAPKRWWNSFESDDVVPNNWVRL